MIYFIDAMAVSGFKVPSPHERVLKVIVSPELGGSEDLTVLLSIIRPNNTTGMHTHDSTEIMYVVNGRGIAIVGDEKREIKTDIVLIAPRGVPHEVKNTGDETLKIVCFYVPALKPEGNYKEAINKAKQYFESLK